MQIEPQTPLALVYKIEDPSLFTNTYYVRAKIRDSYTGSLIESINLTRSSDGSRYTSQTNSPADPSGLGRLIDVTISVYSDSGYTTYASEGFAERIERFLVRTQQHFFGGVSGGNSDIDYDRIEKILEKVVTVKVDIPQINFSEVKTLLNFLIDLVEKLDKKISLLPTETKSDYTPIISNINSIGEKIIKSFPKIQSPKETDFSPILSALTSLSEKISESGQIYSAQKESIISEISALLKDNLDNGKKLQEFKNILNSLETKSNSVSPVEKEKPQIKTPLISKYFKS